MWDHVGSIFSRPNQKLGRFYFQRILDARSRFHIAWACVHSSALFLNMLMSCFIIAATSGTRGSSAFGYFKIARIRSSNIKAV